MCVRSRQNCPNVMRNILNANMQRSDKTKYHDLLKIFIDLYLKYVKCKILMLTWSAFHREVIYIEILFMQWVSPRELNIFMGPGFRLRPNGIIQQDENTTITFRTDVVQKLGTRESLNSEVIQVCYFCHMQQCQSKSFFAHLKIRIPLIKMS